MQNRTNSNPVLLCRLSGTTSAYWKATGNWV